MLLTNDIRLLGRVRKIAKIDYSLCHVCLSVRPRGITRPPLDGLPLNLILKYFSKICMRKFEFHQNMTRITGTLHEDVCSFMITSPSILLRMRNVSDRSCSENQNIQFVFNNFFFFSKIVPLVR